MLGKEWSVFHASQSHIFPNHIPFLSSVVCIVMLETEPESYFTAREFSIELTGVLACSELLVMNLDS